MTIFEFNFLCIVNIQITFVDKAPTFITFLTVVFIFANMQIFYISNIWRWFWSIFSKTFKSVKYWPKARTSAGVTSKSVFNFTLC